MPKRGRPRLDHTNDQHPLYRSWINMRQRCYNPKNTSYQNYGARGIRVCARWNDFKLFMQDMGTKPGPFFTVERVDNDGDYEPFNCVWATPMQQSKNKRPRGPTKPRKSWRD